MFKDVYKAANDSINADNELLERVLSQKRRRVTPVYKYSSIAAACAAVAVSIAVAPMMINGNVSHDTGDSFGSLMPSPAIEERNFEYEETEQKKAEDNAVISGEKENSKAEKSDAKKETEERVSKSEAKNEIKSAAKSEAKNKVTGVTSEKTDAQQSGAAMYSEEKAEPKAESQTDTVESAAEAADDTAADTEDSSRARKIVNTYTKSIVLCVNSADYGGEYYAQDSYEDLDETGEYTFAEWSLEDYSMYLGADVVSMLELPSDFSYIGSDEIPVSVDENGKPMQDNRIFPYEGSGGRYITVITSKNTLAVQSQLSDGRYEKSDINGVNAVVTGGEGNYKCYMINGGISYVVTARGIDEEELADLLISIAV